MNPKPDFPTKNENKKKQNICWLNEVLMYFWKLKGITLLLAPPPPHCLKLTILIVMNNNDFYPRLTLFAAEISIFEIKSQKLCGAMKIIHLFNIRKETPTSLLASFTSLTFPFSLICKHVQ